MAANPPDLHALSRAAPASPDRAAPTSIPPPAARWKTRILLPGIILASAALMLAYAAREALTPATQVHIAPVVLRQSDAAQPPAGAPAAVAAQQPAGAVVQAPGWVEADPYTINIPALAGGVVREILILEGEPVKAGQIIARLIDDDAKLALAAAEAELDEREAALAAARADLAAAQSQWDNPVERQRMVATAEAMAAETRAELVMLDPQIAAEAARVEELRQEYTRTQQASQSQAISQGDLVRWEQRLKAQQAVHAMAEARRAVLEAQLARQEAELTAARENLRLRIEERRNLDSATAAVAREQAALARARVMRDEAHLRLSRMEITSPAAGIVLSRMVEPGSRLMTADDMNASLVARLYNPERLQVRVDIPLAEAMRVGIGQEATIATEAIPNRTFSGRISRLIHEANIQKNTVQVKVQITDPAAAGLLKPEMLTRVKFSAPPGHTSATPGAGAQTAPAGHTMLAHRAALIDVAGATARIWILDQSSSAAALRDVHLGAEHDDEYIEILDGLRPGDRIIVNPPPNLKPGSRVKASEWRAELAAAGGAS